MLAELGGDRPRGGARVAGDGEVEVGDLAPQRRVANRPADDPDPLALSQAPARGLDQRRGAQPVGGLSTL